MPAKAQSHFHGVRPGDHYMPLQRLTIGASHASYSTIISNQAVPYWTRGDIYCPGVSTL
jgi:hypothetical protein